MLLLRHLDRHHHRLCPSDTRTRKLHGTLIQVRTTSSPRSVRPPAQSQAQQHQHWQLCHQRAGKFVLGVDRPWHQVSHFRSFQVPLLIAVNLRQADQKRGEPQLVQRRL